MLQIREPLQLNADPLLAVEAMEAFHAKDVESIKSFANDLHESKATQFFTLATTTICFMTIKGIEALTGNPDQYINDALEYIKENGVNVSDETGVDPHALSGEVGKYIIGTLLPTLNGEEATVSIDFPNDQPVHTHQYVVALTFVSYAFFVTAHKAVTEDEISFEEIRNQINIRNQQMQIVMGAESNPNIPREAEGVSHFARMNRSIYDSPFHEVASSVDVQIPLALIEHYVRGDKAAYADLVRDIFAGKLSLDEVLKSVIHFCRAVLIIIFSMTTLEDRESYIPTVNANIAKSRQEGLVTKRFGISQENLDGSTKEILMALSSLMSNQGAVYDAALPDPDNESYQELLHAYIVALSMVADAYSVLITGKLGMHPDDFSEQLKSIFG